MNTLKTIKSLSKDTRVTQNNKMILEPVESKKNNSPIEKQTAIVKVNSIKVPSWYPRKYISHEEMSNAKKLISQGKLGWEAVVVRYDRTSKEYELIRGLISLRAFQDLQKETIEVELVSDDRLDKSEAIITSLSYSCLSPLNHWESTITGLSYLVEVLEIKTKEIWHDVPGIGTRQKITISQLDQAIGKCVFTLKKRKAELSLSNTNLSDNEYYQKLEAEVTSKVEQAIDRMLSAIGIDIVTFVQKRIPLTKLPNDIANALSSGRLHYSKAIALSKVGYTQQIRNLVDVLNDSSVIKAIIEEQSELLQKTIDNKWTNSRLNEEITLANNRILLIGTNEDNTGLGLSVDEIGDRKAIKEDLKLQADVVQTLTRCKRKLNDFNFISGLTEREKSQFQIRIKNLNNMIVDHEAKVKARSQKN